MDAAQRLIRNSALLLVSALLLAAPGWATPPITLPTLVAPATVNIGSTASNTAAPVSSNGTTVIAYNVGAPVYGSGATGWLHVTPANPISTPSTLTFTVQGVPGLTACSSATVTLTPTASANYDTTPQTVTVVYTNNQNCGTGGGGGTSTTLTANPTSLNLTNAANSNTVAITTSSATTLTLGVGTTVTTTTNGINWLGATLSNTSINSSAGVTVTVTANATGLTYGQAYSGTVTVTPSSGTALTIPINFAVGTTNSTTWSATPNPVNWSFTTGSGVFPTQSVGVTTTSSSTTYNVSVTSQNNWLALNLSGTQYTTVSLYPLATAFQLVVSSNANALAAGVYTGYAYITDSGSNPVATVTVNLTVNGGTGTSASWNATPNPVALSFTTGSATFPTQTVSVSTTGSSPTYNVTVSSLNNWLALNLNGVQYSTVSLYPVNSSFVLAVANNANNLAAGTYTGYAYITDSANLAVQTVTVTLSVNGGGTSGLTISPNPANFSASAGSTAQQTMNVGVTSTIGGSLGVTGSLPSWLSFQVSNPTISAGGTGQIVLYVNPANLASSNYSASLQVTVGGQSGTLTVNLAVGSNGSTTGTTAVAPTAFNFAYELSSSQYPRPGYLAITGPAGSWSSSISYGTGAGWLTISPSTGNSLPDPTASGASPTISINTAGLAVGTYTATINVTTGGGTQAVSVTLLVTAAGTPVLVANPSSLIFTAQTGQAKPPLQQFYFSGSNNSIGALNISATTATPWITITGLTSSGFSVQVDHTQLTTGTYSGTIAVTQANATNSPLNVPVVLVVNGGGTGTNTGTLTFSPTSLSFNSVSGSTPLAQALGVSAANGSTSFSASINYINGSGWLTVTPLTGVTNANLTVSVSPAGLSAGTYSANIAFISSGLVQNVAVTFTVGNANTGNVTVSPASLSFSNQAGTSPATQQLTVNSAAGVSGVTFTILPTTTTGGTWLSTSAASTTTANNTVVTVTVSDASLAAGTYNGNLAVTPTGGTVVNVPVTLTVTAPPTVAATPTALTFNYQAGSAAPPSQSLSVSGGSVSTSLAFSATASSTGNWLTVSPVSGTTPATLAVSVSPGTLAAGQYTGTVTVAGTGSATGTTSVIVTLNVTAPLPTLTRVTNAASYAQGSIAPGEIITLFAADTTHPIGPVTPVGLALDSSTGKVATTLGGVQVLINGYAAPLIYVSATQISAVVPYELAQFTSAQVLVKFLGQSSNGVSVNVTTTAPGLFTANSSGTGPGAILNSNSTVNTPNNPATRGDTVVIYMTGEGQTSPAGVTGKVTTVAAPPQPLTPGPLLQVSVSIGGQAANWSFAGEAPGFVSGVMQLNVQVPTNISAGDQPIMVSIGTNPSQNGVTVSVR